MSRMKKWLLRGLMILAGLAVLLAGVVALQPADYSVERSITIRSGPGPVFAQLETLKAWDHWNPSTKLDPNARVEFSGPPSGKGASMAWWGNAEVGEGTMTITGWQQDKLVELEQVFVKPMAGKAMIKLMLAPESESPASTRVTMRLEGSNGFLGKAACLMMNMDEMVGGIFAKGLANLKELVESGKGK